MRFQSSLRKLGHLAIQSSYTTETTICGSRVSAAFLRKDFIPKLPQPLFGQCHSFILPSWPLSTTDSITYDLQYQTQTLYHYIPSSSKYCSNLNLPSQSSSHTPPINTCHHASFPTICHASVLIIMLAFMVRVSSLSLSCLVKCITQISMDQLRLHDLFIIFPGHFP